MVKKLLLEAREIASEVLENPDQATIREVFMQLCRERELAQYENANQEDIYGDTLH